jgi:hypothetical protein
MLESMDGSSRGARIGTTVGLVIRLEGTHMNTTEKIVACICIFSILLMGCYTSKMIDPTGSEKESIYAHYIKYVTL